MRAAQANMRPPPVSRFYKAVEVREADCRHALLLDGRGAARLGTLAFAGFTALGVLLVTLTRSHRTTIRFQLRRSATSPL